MYDLLSFLATIAVVPLPMKGSNIISLGLLPAKMHGSMSSGGNTAKCAPLYGLGGIDHTERLFFFG